MSASSIEAVEAILPILTRIRRRRFAFPNRVRLVVNLLRVSLQRAFHVGWLVLLALGCSTRQTSPLPPSEFYAQSQLYSPSSPEHCLPEQQTFAVLEATPPAPATSSETACRSYNILALSGAGQYAAYAAGLLVEWRAQGTCPDFDIYTGISSGAIVALLAALGPDYHDDLEQILTTLKFDELFRMKPLVWNILRHGAIAYPVGAAKLVDRVVNADLVERLAAVHQSGKRVYVGTMEVHQRRLVVWDLGAIACGCEANKVRIIRDIMLAACSIPGFVPTVPITVYVDGVPYEEHHGDAGAVAQIFVRLCETMPRPQPGSTRPWLAGSNLYLLCGNKIFADPAPSDQRFLGLATGAISATLYALNRADLWRLYAFCRASGMKFHIQFIPNHADIPPSSIKFDPVEERKLFELGQEFIRSGAEWRHTPPGVPPGEELPTRTGVRFFKMP